jgi:hypothetical protein
MSLVDCLRTALQDEPDVEFAVLFGSRARGTAGVSSDIDLAVRLVRGDPLALAARLERMVGHCVDIVDADAAPPQLRHEIGREGVVLVERVPNTWADYRARAMLDWWDWAPIAQRIHRAAAERLRERTGVGQGDP